MQFAGKTFWITGASSGMGKSTAIELARHQVRLILSGRDRAGLEETAKAVEARGSVARIELLDMQDTAAVEQLGRQIIAEEKLDGLYQFAGISQRSLITETPLANFRKIMEINYFGVVALCQVVLPHMLANGGGQMAVASSMVGKFGFPLRSAYASSKHALHGYFETLYAENAKHGLKISLLIGGRIQTNISKFALNKDGQEHGKLDAGQANGISAEKAAKQICRGLRKEKKEIKVGGGELIMLQIKRFCPALYYKLAQKINPM